MLLRILSPAEVEALTAVRTHRDRTMVAVLVPGGLRRCAVLGLRPEELHAAERRVFIAEGKRGWQCLIPVSDGSSPRWPRRSPGEQEFCRAGVGPDPGAVSGTFASAVFGLWVFELCLSGPSGAHQPSRVAGPGHVVWPGGPWEVGRYASAAPDGVEV